MRLIVCCAHHCHELSLNMGVSVSWVSRSFAVCSMRVCQVICGIFTTQMLCVKCEAMLDSSSAIRSCATQTQSLMVFLNCVEYCLMREIFAGGRFQNLNCCRRRTFARINR